MDSCLIDGCPNEAKFVAKSGGRTYYACDMHRKDVAQIVAAEHTKSEMKRIEKAAEILYLKNKEKEAPPKWIGF